MHPCPALVSNLSHNKISTRVTEMYKNIGLPTKIFHCQSKNADMAFIPLMKLPSMDFCRALIAQTCQRKQNI